MSALRPVEEYDSRGVLLRVNASITFRANETVRTIIGRHDWREEKNPQYHPPVTVQVWLRDGNIPEQHFFYGTPESTISRNAAKEITQAEVPKYILDQLKANPMKVRVPVPTVYEVRLAVLGDVPVAEIKPLAADALGNVTIEPVAPNLDPAQLQGGRPSTRAVNDESVAAS